MSHKIQTLSGYIHEYQKSVLQPEEFWARIAESFHWQKPWSKVLDWNFSGPDVTWFKDGKLNLTENIFERHLFTKGIRRPSSGNPTIPVNPGAR
jgi:acetyl-CoA synthetase